jgi:hypothetical protein
MVNGRDFLFSDEEIGKHHDDSITFVASWRSFEQFFPG